MKKVVIALLALVLSVPSVKADEGMWLLPFIEKLNIKQMHERGLKLSAQDIYDVNNSSLKDAIVQFGRGCTGEIISSEGLILTNHHCGFGQIQAHSTVENDYLKNGFWAESYQRELPNPGLTVTFVKNVEDVTPQITEGVTAQMTETDRAKVIEDNIQTLEAKYENQAKGMSAIVRPMYGGNQYILFELQIFRDIRLVGTPPQSVGKFGGETDNWMWPRHTGDFSMFRVYADKDGNPADYSDQNVPYQPKRHLQISLKGYQEGDYAMIMGFPGRTNRYMTSWEIDQTLSQDNPIRIFVRGERQQLLWQDMLSSDKVRIQYASKYASSSNYWKNSIGMSRGLKKLDIRKVKEANQKELTDFLAANPKLNEKYGQGLSLIQKAVLGRKPIQRQSQMLSETMMNSAEIYMAAAMFNAIIADTTLSKEAKKEKLLSQIGEEFYKDYNMATDRKVTQRMVEIYTDSIPDKQRASAFVHLNAKNIPSYVDKIYSKSPFATKEAFVKLVESGKWASVNKDLVVVGAKSIVEKIKSLKESLTPYSELFARGHRLYLAALLEMNKDKKSLSPDANLTLRMTYGNVLPYNPADGITYHHYTTLDGMIAKEDAANPEFVVPAKLKELYMAKDFGQYGYKGSVPTALITNNDITGGNSGSPVLNAEGQLIGTAFDGNWEAMSGDIAFEPDLQRTISVDVRYVLFIVDKYAGAQRLIDEMDIVK